MANDEMRYDRLVEQAMRGVVREALKGAAADGLAGDHHFYITFRTRATGVVIAEHLREKYEDEMTIVLQHQFYGLDIKEDHFEVTLSFSNVPERLIIPFDAISIFADPSVNFALQFQVEVPDEEVITSENGTDPSGLPEEVATLGGQADSSESNGDGKSGEVVSLDQFRRR